MAGTFIEPFECVNRNHFKLGESVKIRQLNGSFPDVEMKTITITWNRSTKRKEVAQSWDYWTNGENGNYLYYCGDRRCS